jgi:signal transduction histidine kinase
MQPTSAATPDLARHLDDPMRTQERQLVVVRLAVVVLGLAFLVLFGAPINGRLPVIAVLAGVAAYSLLIPIALRSLPAPPVAAFGVVLDVLAVSAVVWLATNVPDAYLFYSVVILGAAIRFGLVVSVVASVAIGAVYVAIVVAAAGPEAVAGTVLPVRVLYLVIFGVVAGLFSQIIRRRAAENAVLQQRLEAEGAERDRRRERELLSRVGRDFGASLERDATERAVARGAGRLLGDATLLATLDGPEGSLVPAAVGGPDRPLAERWRAAIDRRPAPPGGVLEEAAAQGHVVIARVADAVDGPAAEGLRDLGVDWLVAAPIQAGARTLGVLATAGRGDGPDDRVRRMTESLAERAGPALENATLWSDLQQRVAREEHAQRVKDDFLSVVSHELRTPLTSIQGYSQLLESRLRAAGAGPKEMRHVGVILSQVTRMRRLVDDLLDVNRIDRRGGVSVEPVPFDLAELLREAVGRTRRAEPEREVTLSAPDSLSVQLDRERIDQVLGNLLDNAVKYSPDGGPVRVTATVSGDAAEVRVADAGIGIPPEQRDQVFERFYQADDGQGRRRFGGLGLGLAISRAIVEAHGGEIGVTPNRDDGRGSVFWFRVPLVASHASAVEIAGDDDAPPFVRERAAP